MLRCPHCTLVDDGILERGYCRHCRLDVNTSDVGLSKQLNTVQASILGDKPAAVEDVPLTLQAPLDLAGTTLPLQTKRETHERLFPLIRCRPLGSGRYEFFRITQQGLTIGHVWGPITEEFLTEIGEQSGHFLLDKLTPSRLIFVDQLPLTGVRQVSRTRFGCLSKSAKWIRYTVETAKQHYHLWVRGQDEENIALVLEHLLGDRFDPLLRQTASIMEQVLFSMAVLVAAIVSISWWRPALLWIGFVMGVITGYLALCLINLPPNDSPALVRPERRGKAGRKPFRSLVLGWLCKAIGLIWIILVLRPELVFPDVAFLSNWQGRTFLCFAGLILLKYGHQMCLYPILPFQHSDPRAPVLYLRGFDDDGRKTYQPTGFFALLHGIGWNRWEDFSLLRWKFFFSLVHPVLLARMAFKSEEYSAEELLVKAFNRIGPVVAIGQPGEQLQTPGADRMYVLDDDWQQVVLSYLNRCQAVLVQPSDSEGIRWEIEQVFKRLERYRVLLSMVNFHRRPNAYENFREWFELKFSIQLPVTIPFLDRPCFVYWEKDGAIAIQQVRYNSPFLWSFTGDAVNCKQTFFSFVQGLQGDPQRPPLQQKPYILQGIVSLSVPLLIFNALGVVLSLPLPFFFFGGVVFFGLLFCINLFFREVSEK
jgi:hypothetical protein